MTYSPKIIAPNLKNRLSGVTTTIANLVPLQAKKVDIKATGPGLPSSIPHLRLLKVVTLPRAPKRIWHARRNLEMLVGIILKYLFRKNLKLLFTTSSQRHLGGFTHWMIGRMDRIVATSKKTLPFLRYPAEIIGHGVDIDIFYPSEDKDALRAHLNLPSGRLIGCFGRIRPEKGTDIFLSSFIKIAAQNPDAHAIIVGKVQDKFLPFKQKLEELVQSHGLTDHVHILPEIPVDKIAQYYRALDLFVTVPLREGYGLTPLEAMASGVPVITSTAGAFEEMVKVEQTGWLVTINDQAALDKTLAHALSDTKKLAQMGQQARLHMEDNYSLEKEADALIEIYQQLLKS